MPILQNWWNKVIDWFHDRNSRNELIRSFNRSSRESFTMGIVPVFMEASISKGDPNYRHSFTNRLMGSGFRIKAFSGRQMSRDEIVALGEAILSDDILVRKMVVLGWDTLEIHCDMGHYGCKWQLQEYLLIN